MINLIKNFYENAYARIKIKSNNKFTNFVKVTLGVLKGEVLSSILFSIFINDLEQFLMDHGCRGLSITSMVEILLLAYADDLVMLSDTPTELSRKLEALRLYCCENKLSVNVDKTKIVIFCKGNNNDAKKFKSFKFGEEKIEVVDEYVYLGVTIDSNLTFSKATRKFVSSAKSAIGATMRIIYCTRADSWVTYAKLLDRLVKSNLYYAVQIWGLNHLEDIEKVQLAFFKQLLFLPRNTPNYAVRLEVGRLPLSCDVMGRTLAWISKINEMDNSRYPRHCLLRLIALARPEHAPGGRMNWCNCLKRHCLENGLAESESFSSLQNLVKNKDLILRNYNKFMLERDFESRSESKSLTIWPYLSLQSGAQAYLFKRLNLDIKRIFAQMRMNNEYSKYILINKIKYNLPSADHCLYCEELCDNFHHFLVDCPKYNEIRDFCFPERLAFDTHGSFWMSVLSSDNVMMIKKFIEMITSMLALRS